MTSTEGIYRDPADPKTLVEQVTAKSMEELEEKVRQLQESCVGASRAGRTARKPSWNTRSSPPGRERWSSSVMRAIG